MAHFLTVKTLESDDEENKGLELDESDDEEENFKSSKKVNCLNKSIKFFNGI